MHNPADCCPVEDSSTPDAYCRMEAYHFVEQPHSSPEVTHTRADRDGSIVCQQIGLGRVGCAPGGPEEVHHPGEVQRVPIGL